MTHVVGQVSDWVGVGLQNMGVVYPIMGVVRCQIMGLAWAWYICHQISSQTMASFWALRPQSWPPGPIRPWPGRAPAS